VRKRALIPGQQRPVVGTVRTVAAQIIGKWVVLSETAIEFKFRAGREFQLRPSTFGVEAMKDRRWIHDVAAPKYALANASTETRNGVATVEEPREAEVAAEGQRQVHCAGQIVNVAVQAPVFATIESAETQHHVLTEHFLSQRNARSESR